MTTQENLDAFTKDAETLFPYPLSNVPLFLTLQQGNRNGYIIGRTVAQDRIDEQKTRIHDLEDALHDIHRILTRMGERSLKNSENQDLTEMYDCVLSVFDNDEAKAAGEPF